MTAQQVDQAHKLIDEIRKPMRIRSEYRDADMVIVSLPEKTGTGFDHHRGGIDMTERQAIDAIVAVG